MDYIFKPMSYVLVIVMGYLLKRAGFFGRDDHRMMSKIMVNITLPCTIVQAFDGFERDAGMFVIVGIGINLYEPEEGFPEDIREKAGSILGKRSEGKIVDRNRIAAELIREFYALAPEKKLAQEYIDHNMVPGHDIMIIDGKTQRPARATGIRPDGTLEIVEQDGSEGTLVFGEVSVRLRNGDQIVYK